MNIKELLIAEHSKKQTDGIVKYIGADAQRFAVLMKLFFAGEYRITQRAAWSISYCVKNHPELIKPYFKKLLDFLQKPGVHNAVARNTVRLLQDIDIPEKYQGQLMSICFDYIQDIKIPAAVKAFSLTILQNLSKKYPEILPELKTIIEEQWPHETPAFKSRAKKILLFIEAGKKEK
jgi:hypothetical protein